MTKSKKPAKKAVPQKQDSRSGNPAPNPATQFQPGVSGNPGGKPVNARNRLTKRFLEDLAEDFDANGKAALVAARTDDPMGYIRAIASLLPKEMIIERPLEQLSDEELAIAIADLRTRLAQDAKATTH